ncbi:MAG: hypothetical protein E6Q97_34150 [Desulfurellales bacterium]|nr:MAG: hypothetical protein E6Q97_34150 [Desulfurellales bacterium]
MEVLTVKILRRFFVCLFISVLIAGNVYQARHWLRAQALILLDGDKVIHVEVKPKEHGVGVAVGLLRADMERWQADQKKEMQALSEKIDHYKVFAEQTQYDLDQAKSTCKEIDTNLRGFRDGVTLIRGELIRSGHLPKEMSTAF